jgi:hypothetical protein
MIITILILVGLIVPVSAAVIPIFKFGQVFSAKVLQGDGMKSQQMMMEINRIIYLISEFTYNYREKNGTYSGISSEELAKLMPTKTLTTPWGSTILIGNISQDSYTVTLNDTPMDVCKYLLSSMTNNPMQHSDSQCNDDWSNDFTYTFTYMTRDQMYKYNMEQSRLHQR